MSNSPEERRRLVLDRIRKGVSGDTPQPHRAATVAQRLAKQAPHLIPERVQKAKPELDALLVSHLKGQSATIAEAKTEAEVPTAIAAFLRSANLPMRLRMGDDARLAQLPWSSEPTLTVEKGRAKGDDTVGLSHAFAGIAETGTLLLASGTDNPVTLNFLPETHVVVLKRSDIAGPYEEAFDRVRAALGRGTMPRTLNMISGPSRTGDIGGRLVMGAHGPRRMCVVIVG